MQQEHNHTGEFNYNYIVDSIYAGNNQCCVVGLSTMLIKNDIRVDISLEEENVYKLIS